MHIIATVLISTTFQLERSTGSTGQHALIKDDDDDDDDEEPVV